MWGRLDSWFCHKCVGAKDLRNDVNDNNGRGWNEVMRRSTVAFKTIQQMTAHGITVHGDTPPEGWEAAVRRDKNKAKAQRKKRGKK